MDDLVRRQDAIDAVRKKIADYIPLLHGWLNGLPIGIEMGIRQVPSAQKKGHWIDEETHYLCSECHRGCWVNSDYCPWCGADMRGDESE